MDMCMRFKFGKNDPSMDSLDHELYGDGESPKGKTGGKAGKAARSPRKLNAGALIGWMFAIALVIAAILYFKPLARIIEHFGAYQKQFDDEEKVQKPKTDNKKENK
jgi:hypothetical protein